MPDDLAGSTSILKSISAYSDATDTDSQFFPTEPRPPIASLPIASTEPAEDDYDDPEGSMFSGPAARSVPTSTSTFRMRARSRGELERMSRDLERERDEREEREEEEDAKSMGGRSRRSRKSGKGKGKSKRRSSRRGSDATSVGGTTDAGESDGESLAPSSRGGTPRLKDPGTPSRRPQIGRAHV